MIKTAFSLKLILLTILSLSFAIIYFSFLAKSKPSDNTASEPAIKIETKNELHLLAIEGMRQKEYSGSEIKIEQDLPYNSYQYQQYIASYNSQGLKIYGLLTVPIGEKPLNGWPVIIFNHGYIPPEQYKTTERYVAYVDAFAGNGYIVFKPDYRGHGNSEGRPEGAYYSPAYTEDVLNALSSLKKFPEANPERIGMWGHSMGGYITLRSMVITKDIKVGVIWAGVVANYEDMMTNWRRSLPWIPSQREQFRMSVRQRLVEQYGEPKNNPQFWDSIAPINFVKDISGPVQIHHGSADEEVPILFSERLKEALSKEQKVVEYFSYPGDDHNLSNNLNLALDRSVKFFDKYLK